MNGIIYAGGDISINSSKNYEVILPLGTGSINCGEVTPIKCGQVIVIPPLTKFELGLSKGLRVTIEKALLPLKRVRVLDDDGAMAFAINQAVKYFESENARRHLILSALGSLLVGYINAFTVQKKYSPVVSAVADGIEKSLSDPTFSLDDYLKTFPLNYDYLRRLFKKEVGASPREYLLHGRMELARGIILGGLSNRYSDYTVSQIAEACGYSDPLYFSRVFKSYFGIAPSEYGK